MHTHFSSRSADNREARLIWFAGPEQQGNEPPPAVDDVTEEADAQPEAADEAADEAVDVPDAKKIEGNVNGVTMQATDQLKNQAQGTVDELAFARDHLTEFLTDLADKLAMGYEGDMSVPEAKGDAGTQQESAGESQSQSPDEPEESPQPEPPAEPDEDTHDDEREG